jgi:hypothetical protein
MTTPQRQQGGRNMNCCRWCNKPAVVEIIVEPDKFGMVARNDGRKIKTLVRRAITAPACSEHRFITVNQPPPVKTPHTTKLKGERQANLWERYEPPSPA